MSVLVLAVPAKGRLQENAEAFFARAGLELVKPRGARDYRGGIKRIDSVEVAFLSAAEITEQLAAGAVHFGITGEDLVREMIPDADRKVVLLDGLGFGYANVVVAVPEAWIDVRDMADLDDVAISFRSKHDRRLRVATKYLHLTRGFFSRHGIVDYRIVESAGATEGAPAAGIAELIVDITHKREPVDFGRPVGENIDPRGAGRGAEIADEPLHQRLKSDQAGRAAVFVDDQSFADAKPSHRGKQVVGRQRLRDG